MRGDLVHHRLSGQYGNSVLPQQSVYEWTEKLKNGHTSVTNEEGVGRPSMATNDDNIEHAHGRKEHGLKKSSVKLKDIKKEVKDVKNIKSNGNINCQCCNFSSKQPKEIVKHLYNHRDCRMRHKRNRNAINKFVCPDCPFETHHVSSIQNHMKTHGKSKQEKQNPKSDNSKNSSTSVFSPVFLCDVCKQEFNSLSNFECHRKYSHVQTYTCDTCGETFQLAVFLKSHLKSIHGIHSD